MTHTILLNMRDANTLSGWTSSTGFKSLEVELVNHLSSQEVPLPLLLCRACDEDDDDDDEDEETSNVSSSKYSVSWYCHAW